MFKAIIIALLTIVVLYYVGWLNPEAEERVERSFEAIEESGVLDTSLREIREGTSSTIREAIEDLDEIELNALLEKLREEDIDSNIDKEEVETIIKEELKEE